MSEVKTRGYSLLNTAAYLRHAAGPDADRIMEGLSPALRQALNGAAPTGWQPAAYTSELAHEIAKLANGDETKAREQLEACGEFVGKAATTTFLKLVMKVLTPTMFAKKLPTLWSRDATGGTYVVDVFEDHIVCRLKDMEAFAHMGPISVGYVRFALKSMGMQIVSSKLHDWALDKPIAPAWFEIYWKK